MKRPYKTEAVVFMFAAVLCLIYAAQIFPHATATTSIAFNALGIACSLAALGFYGVCDSRIRWTPFPSRKRLEVCCGAVPAPSVKDLTVEMERRSRNAQATIEELTLLNRKRVNELNELHGIVAKLKNPTKINEELQALNSLTAEEFKQVMDPSRKVGFTKINPLIMKLEEANADYHGALKRLDHALSENVRFAMLLKETQINFETQSGLLVKSDSNVVYLQNQLRDRDVSIKSLTDKVEAFERRAKTSPQHDNVYVINPNKLELKSLFEDGVAVTFNDLYKRWQTVLKDKTELLNSKCIIEANAKAYMKHTQKKLNKQADHLSVLNQTLDAYKAKLFEEQGKRNIAERQASTNSFTPEIISLLASHLGETGANEGATEVIKRLSQFWKKLHAAFDLREKDPRDLKAS